MMLNTNCICTISFKTNLTSYKTWGLFFISAVNKVGALNIILLLSSLDDLDCFLHSFCAFRGAS